MDNKNIYIEYAKHCIGLNRKEPYKRHGRLYYRPYRNYFYASGNQSEIWNVMFAAGYADCGAENSNGGHTYWLTRAGLDWLGEKLGIHIYDEED